MPFPPPKFDPTSPASLFVLFGRLLGRRRGFRFLFWYRPLPPSCCLQTSTCPCVLEGSACVATIHQGGEAT